MGTLLSLPLRAGCNQIYVSASLLLLTGGPLALFSYALLARVLPDAVFDGQVWVSACSLGLEAAFSTPLFSEELFRLNL